MSMEIYLNGVIKALNIMANIVFIVTFFMFIAEVINDRIYRLNKLFWVIFIGSIFISLFMPSDICIIIDGCG